MYLATMLNSYSATTGGNDVKRTRDEVERTKQFRVVEYMSKKELKEDLELVKRDETGDVYVLERKDAETDASGKLVAGKAANEGVRGGGVLVGHLVFKIN